MEVTREDIRAADERIRSSIRTTPVVEVEPGFYLKLESLQRTGSFKVRGAFNFLAAHPEVDHVVAASGGNHGLAVAFAATQLGRQADIFCPSTSPVIKLDRIRATGANLHVVDGFYPAALQASRQHLAENPGAVELHAFDHPAVVAGQGTCGQEILEQIPDLAEVVVAVGGGGLIAGIASWIRDDAAVVAAETEGTPALHASLEAGKPIEVEVGGVAADSLGAARVGDIAFETALRWVDESVIVTDAEVIRAQRWLWDELRLVAEPGAATAVAVALQRRDGSAKPICAVVSGANTSPANLDNRDTGSDAGPGAE